MIQQHHQKATVEQTADPAAEGDYPNGGGCYPNPFFFFSSNSLSRRHKAAVLTKAVPCRRSHSFDGASRARIVRLKI
jgi:hypothetical protein